MDFGLNFFRIGLVICAFGVVSGQLISPVVIDYTKVFNESFSGVSGRSYVVGMQNTPDKIKFNHEAILSELGDVKLAWNFTEESITFKLSVRTTGWIGMGIASDSFWNAGADFVVMGHRKAGSYIADMHIDEDGRYIVDKVQDVKQKFIWELEDETIAIFTRPLVTCDHDEDVDITPDSLRIIWAYGKEDIDGYSSQEGKLVIVQDGSINMKLLNPLVPPLQKTTFGNDIQTLEVTVQKIRIEKKLYSHCTAFRFPEVERKAHIVQFQPIISIGNEYYVRQITIRQCTGLKPELSSVQQVDLDCDDVGFNSNCKTILFKWAIGMPTLTFPENVGFAIGESNTYFMMDIVYTNPGLAGVIDSSGMKIYYTSRLRQYEAGILTTGSMVGPYESQIIPPKTQNFVLRGYCMKECIQMALPKGGNVTIFAALLHTRATGMKIKIRHFRDGKELAPIAEDNQYNFLPQKTQFLNRYVQLKESDNMIVECTYDTMNRKEITYVNNSRNGESCLAFISYYPRIAKFTACETAPTEKVTMDTVGAARPEEMKKHAKEFDWSKQKIREYNDQILASQVYVHCGDVRMKEAQPIPVIKKAYVEHHKCKKPEPDTRFQISTARSFTTKQNDSNSSTNRASSLFSLPTTVLYLITALIPHRLKAVFA